jgi:hypothetical protein
MLVAGCWMLVAMGGVADCCVDGIGNRWRLGRA